MPKNMRLKTYDLIKFLSVFIVFSQANDGDEISNGNQTFCYFAVLFLTIHWPEFVLNFLLFNEINALMLIWFNPIDHLQL